jgi:hypothetical protein
MGEGWGRWGESRKMKIKRKSFSSTTSSSCVVCSVVCLPVRGVRGVGGGVKRGEKREEGFERREGWG